MFAALGFIAAALLAYSLPWLVGPGTSLTFNAYDLAEWTSLHPSVRAATPPLALTFALRSLPVLLVVLLATQRLLTKGFRWATVIIGLVVALALLPPLAFFRQGFGDPNYRQQFVLAVIALITAGLAATGRYYSVYHSIHIGAGLMLVAVGVVTVVRSITLMQSFSLTAQVGAGAVGFVALATIYSLYSLRNKRGNS